MVSSVRSASALAAAVNFPKFSSSSKDGLAQNNNMMNFSGQIPCTDVLFSDTRLFDDELWELWVSGCDCPEDKTCEKSILIGSHSLSHARKSTGKHADPLNRWNPRLTDAHK